jgi:hypothetical protein
MRKTFETKNSPFFLQNHSFQQILNFRILIQMVLRIRIGNPDPDPDQGRPKLSPKKERNFMLEEFSVGLEASPGA